MATRDEYNKAIDAVKTDGSPTSRQRELVERAARQAGSMGNRARDAQKSGRK